MNLDHRDQVSVLTRRAGRQQPQLSGALHCRGAIAGLELGVDVAHVGADGVQRGDGDVLSTTPELLRLMLDVNLAPALWLSHSLQTDPRVPAWMNPNSDPPHSCPGKPANRAPLAPAQPTRRTQAGVTYSAGGRCGTCIRDPGGGRSRRCS